MARCPRGVKRLRPELRAYSVRGVIVVRPRDRREVRAYPLTLRGGSPEQSRRLLRSPLQSLHPGHPFQRDENVKRKAELPRQLQAFSVQFQGPRVST